MHNQSTSSIRKILILLMLCFLLGLVACEKMEEVTNKYTQNSTTEVSTAFDEDGNLWLDGGMNTDGRDKGIEIIDKYTSSKNIYYYWNRPFAPAYPDLNPSAPCYDLLIMIYYRLRL